MVTKTKVYVSTSVNPYHNLAQEECLLRQVGADECILYLWQNRQTVVIGRNQNAFKECKVTQLADDGGFLARRLSGGGCVYHDMGNLNFTFLVRQADYDVDKQLSVIIRALALLGLHAEKTGRNDLCIDGRKFSGNAFYSHKGHCYHHGTILLDVDIQMMSRYLRVSAEKLKANSVSSVKSRVVNLKDLNGEIEIASLREALIEAFSEKYVAPERIRESELNAADIAALTAKYAADQWRFGEKMKADCVIDGKFVWGEISIALRIQGDRIVNAQVFSDAMDASLAEVLAGVLSGAVFRADGIVDAMARARSKIAPDIYDDIANLITTQEIW